MMMGIMAFSGRWRGLHESIVVVGRLGEQRVLCVNAFGRTKAFVIVVQKMREHNASRREAAVRYDEFSDKRTILLFGGSLF